MSENLQAADKREIVVTRNKKVLFSHKKADSWKIYALGGVLLAAYVFVKVKFLGWHPL